MEEKLLTILIPVGDELINAKILLQEREDNILGIQIEMRYKGKDYALSDLLKEPLPKDLICAFKNMELAIRKCIKRAG